MSWHAVGAQAVEESLCIATGYFELLRTPRSRRCRHCGRPPLLLLLQFRGMATFARFAARGPATGRARRGGGAPSHRPPHTPPSRPGSGRGHRMCGYCGGFRTDPAGSAATDGSCNLRGPGHGQSRNRSRYQTCGDRTAYGNLGGTVDDPLGQILAHARSPGDADGGTAGEPVVTQARCRTNKGSARRACR